MTSSRYKFEVAIPAVERAPIRTRPVSKTPTPGDYTEIDGEYRIIEEVVGGRARIDFTVSANELSDDVSPLDWSE